MIKFRDGTSITNEEAAQLFETEGRLIQNYVSNAEGRCALGVIEDFAPIGLFPRRPLVKAESLRSMITANNEFEGTPEERAAYMAGWMRAR